MVRTGYSGESIGKGTPSPQSWASCLEKALKAADSFLSFQGQGQLYSTAVGSRPRVSRVRPKDSKVQKWNL